MKNGFRVYDVDTHINPGAEVLEHHPAGPPETLLGQRQQVLQAELRGAAGARLSAPGRRSNGGLAFLYVYTYL